MSMAAVCQLTLESPLGNLVTFWHDAYSLPSQTGPERHETAARAVGRPSRLCVLSLRCAAEEAFQDRGVHRRRARVGPARATLCCRHAGWGAHRLCRSGDAGTGETGGWEVASEPQGVGDAR